VKIVLVLVLFAAAAVGVWWFGFRRPPVVEPPPQTDSQAPVTVSSFDEFNQDLAKRVTDVLVPGGAPDFQVVVTPAMDPIGTLYLKGRSVAYDDRSCVPTMEPAARSMPSVFPSYQLDGKIAADFGLDESVLQGVASLGAGVNSGSSFTFSVLNPQLKTLSDRAIQDALTSSSCTMATKGEMVIVRGYVSGQRRFSTKGEDGAKVNAGVAKVGNFKVEGNSAGLVSITDDSPQSFLQILSVVVVAPSNPANPSATPAPVPSVTAPQAVTGEGQVYVQQDQADDPQKGKQVLSQLQGSGFKVENRVEQVASRSMPNQPQVRYFNDGDKARATELLRVVQQDHPDAKLVPVPIKAPKGQLEVWLPRAKQ